MSSSANRPCRHPVRVACGEPRRRQPSAVTFASFQSLEQRLLRCFGAQRSSAYRIRPVIGTHLQLRLAPEARRPIQSTSSSHKNETCYRGRDVDQILSLDGRGEFGGLHAERLPRHRAAFKHSALNCHSRSSVCQRIVSECLCLPRNLSAMGNRRRAHVTKVKRR
jgi:hypothetical protein